MNELSAMATVRREHIPGILLSVSPGADDTSHSRWCHSGQGKHPAVVCTDGSRQTENKRHYFINALDYAI